MTPAEREAQRRSFAYGNAKLSNDAVTREMVDRAAERCTAPEHTTPPGPARTVVAVVICALVMIACAGATMHGIWWCTFGIPLAPLVAVGLTCRKRSYRRRPQA